MIKKLLLHSLFLCLIFKSVYPKNTHFDVSIKTLGSIESYNLGYQNGFNDKVAEEIAPAMVLLAGGCLVLGGTAFTGALVYEYYDYWYKKPHQAIKAFSMMMEELSELQRVEQGEVQIDQSTIKNYIIASSHWDISHLEYKGFHDLALATFPSNDEKRGFILLETICKLARAIATQDLQDQKFIAETKHEVMMRLNEWSNFIHQLLSKRGWKIDRINKALQIPDNVRIFLTTDDSN